MKTIIRIFILLFFFSSCSEKPRVDVISLKCEYKVNPLGVDIEKPRFSWIIVSAQRGVNQSAFQIIVSSDLKKLDENIPDLWDSQKISSDKSIQILYAGKPLQSNQKYFWKVKIWDQNGKVYSSESSYWTTGLFKESDWKAKWIGLDKAVGGDDPEAEHRVLSARMLRHEFNVEKKVKSATAFISGLGLFELYLNGEKIGDQVLAPGLSEYNKRAFYMTFDVTKFLHSDKNAIGVILGNGRFFAPRAEKPKTFRFPKVICQLEIQYEDGTNSTIITDESWKITANGPVRKNNEFDGEFYDARMELNGWNNTGFNDADWMKAELVEKPGEVLVAQPIDPIKIMDQIAPVSVKEIKPGTFIFDMGQNMVGWVELLVKGNKGDKVSLRFAETLKEDGSLFLANIRSAEVTDTYILKGDGAEKWEPRFTYHGFRFVEMTGYPGIPALSAIKGKVVHDALEVTGTFTCSNPLINSIYKNAFWGIRGNYRSMPTDCPQRDERQGWLGDRSAECTGESYIFDISKLYNKWVTDIKDAQLPSGSLPDVAPSFWPIYSDNTTWPGTFLFASDMLYTQYGDVKTLESNYPSMQKWVEHMSGFLKDGIMPKDTYGDWCVPPEDVKLILSSDPQRITSAEYIGTAYFYYELKLMEKFARLLGKENDAESYSKTATEMKTAFNTKFLDVIEGKYSNNTCTASILALAFKLVPDEYKDKIVDNLLQKILGENAGHVGNGIIGGQWLMRTLTINGHEDVAFKLASQSTYPGWGYMVTRGATTIWELWNGDYGDPGMNSGNHVMLLGDLIIWYYENLAGIKADPEIPAFRHIIMKPYVLGDLKYVDASFNSSYGIIKSAWKLENDKFKWNITIPANTTATVYVPTINKEEVMEGNKPAFKSDGVKFIRWENNWAVFEIKSGNYALISNGVKINTTEPYVSTPVITPADTILKKGDKLTVIITCKDSAAKIHYSIDGKELNEASPVYEKPLEISINTTVRAQAFINGYHSSNQSKVIYNYVDPEKNGIIWSLYPGTFIKLPEFDKLNPVASGKVFQFGVKKIHTPKTNFALRLKSFIQIDKAGKYTFYISSNDGSKLYMDNQLLIDNDGEHGVKEMSNSLFLKEGKHLINVEYFQSGGGTALFVGYSSDEIRYQPIPESILFKSKE
ncbi:MAG: family 78 glycoside hydrolase catalytic domain [Mariniphaga sp.]